MANEMIALQAQSPKVMDYADFMGIREHAQDRRAAQNAMLQKQTQENAMNEAYRAAYDPATGQVDSNRLAQSLAQGGLGSQIPGAQKGLLENQKGRADLDKSKVEHLLKFGELSGSEISNSASPEDLVQRMSRLAQMFPDMAPHIAQGIATMPKDPAAWSVWKQEQERKRIPVAERLKRELFKIETETGQHLLAASPYGGAASVVEGSRSGPSPVSKQFIWTQNGLVAGDTRTGGAVPVTEGGGVSGGPVGPVLETTVTQLIPGVRVTSGARSPQHNAAVGGVPNSYHLTDNARDFTPPNGMTMGQLHAALKDRLGSQGYQVINEGDHVHVEPAQSGGRQIQAAPTAAQRDAASGTKPVASSKDVATLRKEFDQLPEVKTFKTMRASMQQIMALGNNPNASATDDVALIFSYMKMLDPTSVVREGEFATAQNTGGIPDQIRNAYNKAISGNRLNAEQRKSMVNSAAKVYYPVRENYNNVANQYHGYARDFGIDPNAIAQRYEPVQNGGNKGGGGNVIHYDAKGNRISG